MPAMVRCWNCKKEYSEQGLIGCDAIYICSDCNKNHHEDVRKIYMHNNHHWNGCSIGWAKGMCPNCTYNDICNIIEKQIHDGRGVAGE